MQMIILYGVPVSSVVFSKQCLKIVLFKWSAFCVVYVAFTENCSIPDNFHLPEAGICNLIAKKENLTI